MSFTESMRELEKCEIDEVAGCGYYSGAAGALSGILWGAAEAAGAFGLEAMVVPGIGTAVGGFLETGAAVMAAAGGVAYLAGN